MDYATNDIEMLIFLHSLVHNISFEMLFFTWRGLHAFFKINYKIWLHAVVKGLEYQYAGRVTR